MDSRTNAIGFHCQTAQESADELLRFVRRNAGPGASAAVTEALGTETGASSSGVPPTTEPFLSREVVHTLLTYLRQITDSDVSVTKLSSREVTGDLQLRADTLFNSLERVGVGGTSAKFYFICPDNNGPMSRKDGKPLELDRLPAETVQCWNHGAEPHEHTARENAILRVGVAPPKPLTKVHFAWLLFPVVFILLSWGFAELSDRYPEHTLLMSIGFALSAIAPVAAIRTMFGPEAFRAAEDLVSRLFAPLLRAVRRARKRK
jgi:hypothetical protein